MKTVLDGRPVELLPLCVPKRGSKRKLVGVSRSVLVVVRSMILPEPVKFRKVKRPGVRR